MTGLTLFLKRHSRALYLIFIMLGIAGYLAFQNLPSDVYPSLSFPRIAVIVSSGDMAPERVLVSITRILEEACGQVYRVRWIRSKTIRGAAEISVEFQPGTDMIFSLHQVQSRIAEVQGQLPAGTSTTIELVTPAIFPVLSYTVTSDSLTQADLYNLARYQIQPDLTRIEGIARVQIQGGDIPELSVQIDPDKLHSYGLSLSQVADAVSKNSRIQVVGRVDTLHQQNLVVADQEARSLSDVENMVITTKPGGQPVFIRDIGQVEESFMDRSSLVSIKRKKGLVVNVFRQPSSNVVKVSEGVKSELKRLKSHLPTGVNINPGYDESALVLAAMDNVKEAILTGIGLIILVLFFFLRSWQSTVIAAISIPLSALAAFAALYLTGQSLNLMSLGGLAIAVGLVIDDAIVVVENIDRQLRRIADPIAAVAQALKELIAPVTSSTLTTVVVFLPLGLLSGVPGQFFTSLTITLSGAVLFSLLLALTLSPMLAAQLLHKGKSIAEEHKRGLLEKIYRPVLNLFLKQSWIVLPLAAGFIFLGSQWYKDLGSDFLPSMDEGSYVLDYYAPAGASLEETDRYADKLEQILARTPEVKTWTRRTGAELGLFATHTNRGDILVVLNSTATRKRSCPDIMEEQRQKIAAELPQLEIEFHQLLQDQLNDLSGAPAPIEVRVFGEDPLVLKELSGQIQEKMKTCSGIVDIACSLRAGAPEIEIKTDEISAGKLGLSAADIGQQVQDALLGRVATQVKRGDRLVKVRVRLNEKDRLDASRLPDLPIIGPTGHMLPLSALSGIRTRAGQQEILCENQQRYASVSSSLEGRDLGSAVEDLRTKLQSLKLPLGYSLELAGLYANQQETFQQLSFVFMFSSFLVYLLLVMQFRSFVQPIAIFAAVPLALVGVIAGLKITGTPLNVSSFMGMILLIGLVVKNGIILLEYSNRLQDEGMSLDDAIGRAGEIRLRPILMTTLCTLLGLFPLALGSGTGAELQKPLAIAVISGLSVSTLFTLLLVPAVYRTLHKLTRLEKRH